MKIKFYSPVTITHWNGCSVPEFNHDYLIEQLEIQCSDLLFRAVCYPEKYGHHSPYGTRYFSYRDNRLYLVSEILVLHPNKDISCTGQWGQKLSIPTEDKSMFKEYLEYLYGSVNGDLSDGCGEEFEQRAVRLKHPEGEYPTIFIPSPAPLRDLSSSAVRVIARKGWEPFFETLYKPYAPKSMTYNKWVDFARDIWEHYNKV